MIDETSIDIVIAGLKGLYEKLALKDKKASEMPSHLTESESAVWFEGERDKCL